MQAVHCVLRTAMRPGFCGGWSVSNGRTKTITGKRTGTGLVRTLRRFDEAANLVYVCSNHKLPLKNLLDFSSVVRYWQRPIDTDPFLPLRVVPIDMCPHTLRSELVLFFKRFRADGIRQRSAAFCAGGDRMPRPRHGHHQQAHRRFRTRFHGRAAPADTAAVTLPPPLPVAQPSSSEVGGLLSYLKRIEERAYQEGLTKGLERKAFQMGYTRGLQRATAASSAATARPHPPCGAGPAEK